MNANSSLTTNKWLESASKQLLSAGIGTAKLDTLVLLEDCLQRDRAIILAHPDIELSMAQQNVLNDQIGRRIHHEPLAYIRQKTEFYGRTFFVNSDVLEPRPETETMIELLKNLPVSNNSVLADIGTGSGAIAITAKLELPDFSVLATDSDVKCITVAKKNSHLLQADVSLLCGDLAQPITDKKVDIILANLPYVPDDFGINRAALHEPQHAIFGGIDGLDLYRRLFSQLATMKQRPKYVFTESLPKQHDQLNNIANSANYNFFQTEDFIQVFIAS